MRIHLIPRKTRLFAIGAVVAVCLLLSLPGIALAGTRDSSAGFYQQTNLVADVANVAPVTDPNLVNPWGLSAGPATPWWAADNGTGLSTLYNGQGQIVPLVVTVPTPTNSAAGTKSTPTGTVFNGTPGFVVSQNGVSGASAFLFDTEDGTISGWNPTVNRGSAILAVDRSKVGAGAVYKGLAIATNETGTFLYATNFRSGMVEVFDANFQLVKSFTDPILAHTCPFLRQCFAPFGIQAIGDKIYVTFALQNARKHDDVSGFAHGFVDVFSTDGKFVKRLLSAGKLNSPWGVALAPANFGKFSNDLLVSNFGDGRINVFSPKTGRFIGQLQSRKGHALVIDGLLAIGFGNGAASGLTNQLYFNAGPSHGKHGLFGFIASLS